MVGLQAGTEGERLSNENPKIAYENKGESEGRNPCENAPLRGQGNLVADERCDEHHEDDVADQYLRPKQVPPSLRRSPQFLQHPVFRRSKPQE